MPENYKIYQHNPPHLFRSNAKYFITGSTYEKVKYLKSNDAKERLLGSIYKGFNDNHWEIEDWVILDNHYHLMVNAPGNAESLGDIIRDIHRFTALWVKKNMERSMECTNRVGACIDTVNALQKKIFHNYWDTCITYEKSYYARLHYIWYNPVKHGYVDDPIKWKFGSYYYRFAEEKDELKKIIDQYPCDRVKVKDDF